MAIRIGAGKFTYEAYPDWARLPRGWRFLEVVDVAADSQDRVYVFSRGEHPLMIFDREGSFLTSWGEGQFKRPHGITLGPKDTLFLADDGGHAQPFNQPTKVARDPKTGELFISDGYGNARVHKYTADGKYLSSWGGPGMGPGEFNLPHSVVLDKEGRLFVADRENLRIQIFNREGKFLAMWNNIHRPCGLHIAGDGDQRVYVGELAPAYPFNQNYPNIGARISIYDLQGNLLARLGDIQAGEGPHQFLAPHGLTVDSRGDIYVGEVSWSFKGKNLTPPRELPTFRKLVKV